MSFISKLWKDRVSDYPNKRKLTKEDGTSETVTVERAEGDIVVAGDAFNAENMNDLETRIQNGFNAVEQTQAELNEKTKEIYKSNAPFEVSQTVHLSGIENGNENSVFLISAYRYAFAGSIVISRKDIVEGNFGEGFIIFAQSPGHYWTFKLNSKFDITLFANQGAGSPYVSVTRL